MAVIYGTQGRDFLEGTGQDDVIQGWAKFGDQSTDLGDELIGGDGGDLLQGSFGDDRLFGARDSDTLSGEGSQAKRGDAP